RLKQDRCSGCTIPASESFADSLGCSYFVDWHILAARTMQPRAKPMAGSPKNQPRYTLESVALFRGVPLSTLERIKSRCSCRCYPPRKTIIDHLDQSDDVCFLLSGHARVTICSADGKAVSFRELGPGAMFGEYAAIDGRPRSANVEA